MMHISSNFRFAMTAAVLLVSACASSASPPAGMSPQAGGSAPSGQNEQNSYDRQSVIGAAEGVFGKGTEGLGKVIERVFAENGRPNAYIAGREGGGAFIAGLRYGNGTLYHKVEGQRTVNWTGPSLGIDIGGDLNKSFVLVYNLYDTEALFKRYPMVEGKVYYIGGFSLNYHRNGNVVLANVRLGGGLRLGANIGYVHYTKERKYNPF
jgi:hypothetical protein